MDYNKKKKFLFKNKNKGFAELSPSSNEKYGHVLNPEEVVETRFCTSLVLDDSSIVLCLLIMCTSTIAFFYILFQKA